VSLDPLTRDVTMGALLHDVGKIVQRAEPDPGLYRHQEWGARWLERTRWSAYARYARYHHRLGRSDPEHARLSVDGQADKALWVVSEADALAGGSERVPEEEWDRAVPLTSILWKLRLSEASRAEYAHRARPWAYPTRPRDADLVLPTPDASATREDYVAVRDALGAALGAVGDPDSLLAALERHTATIPSETEGDPTDPLATPDVSFYDHARVTAAIAACTVRWAEGTGQELSALPPEAICDRAVSRYLLVAGDVSGVQAYLYAVTPRLALRSLRGRSCYLEVLTEHTVRTLLGRLGLPLACVIYQGGGGFYLLAHHAPLVREEITGSLDALNRWLLDRHDGRLFLAHASVPLAGRDFLASAGAAAPLVGAWSRLAVDLGREKAQRFARVLPQGFFEPAAAARDDCEACGTPQAVPWVPPGQQEPLRLCDPCRQMVDLGGALPWARYIVLDGGGTATVAIQGRQYGLAASVPPGSAAVPLPVAVYPCHGTDLDELADQAAGVRRLGVLRMDVDNLGLLLGSGLPAGERTFARLAALSREVHAFFSRIVPLLCQDRAFPGAVRYGRGAGGGPEARDVAIVYSGGDDLLVVGAWDDAVELVISIRRIFYRYACENPDVDLSAGLVIVPPEVPIAQAARQAGLALEDAKARPDACGRKGRAVLVGDLALPWARWEEMLRRVLDPLAAMGEWDEAARTFVPRYPRGLVRRLLALAQEAGSGAGSLVIPRVAYALSRGRPGSGAPAADHQAYAEAAETLLNQQELQDAVPVLAWLELLQRRRDG
jgi:CRISPR-associated protein Csm1